MYGIYYSNHIRVTQSDEEEKNETVFKNVTLRRTKNKGTLEFLQELGVALKEDWQQIPRAEILHITFSVPERCRIWISTREGRDGY